MPEKKQKQKTNSNINTDGLANAISSLGMAGRAKTPASKFATARIMNDVELANIYAQGGIGKRIIDIYPEEMTREWVTIEGDKDGLFQNYLTSLKAQNKFSDLIKWGRLFGGAIIIMGIDDGRALTDPVIETQIKSIDFLRVIDKSEIVIYDTDRYSDPNVKNYNEVELYTIQPKAKGFDARVSVGYKVHESRVIRTDGDPYPNIIAPNNDFWGMSVLAAVYDDLINLAQTYAYGAEMIHELILTVFSIKNLSNLLQTRDGDAIVRRRIETMNYSKSVINGIFIDSDQEGVQKTTAGTAGIENLMGKFEGMLSASSGIPQMILFGKSATGLNAVGDNEMRSWYDHVKKEQEQILLPALQRLLHYISLAEDGGRGMNMDEIEINFNPLWQLDEQQEIELRHKQAETDVMYMTWGVVSEEEVRSSRFEGQYSYETKLNGE